MQLSPLAWPIVLEVPRRIQMDRSPIGDCRRIGSGCSRAIRLRYTRAYAEDVPPEINASRYRYF